MVLYIKYKFCDVQGAPGQDGARGRKGSRGDTGNEGSKGSPGEQGPVVSLTKEAVQCARP